MTKVQNWYDVPRLTYFLSGVMCGASRDVNEASVPALFEAKGIMVGDVVFTDNESGFRRQNFR
jgi:hypothetical protein